MPESLLEKASTRSRSRSHAWIYYAIIAALILIGGFTANANGLWTWMIPAAYAAYIYRGGSFVVWFW